MARIKRSTDTQDPAERPVLISLITHDLDLYDNLADFDDPTPDLAAEEHFIAPLAAALREGQ